MKLSRILCITLISLITGTSAHAATLTNGGFEGSLNPWNQIGNVTNPGLVTLTGGLGGTLSPTEGDNQAVLRSNGGDPAAAGRFSILNFLSGLTDIADLNTFAGTSGLTDFENSNLDEFGDLEGEFFTTGSAISQDSIDVSAGMTMSFDFALATQEASSLFGATPQPDAAFLFADGQFHKLALATEVTPPALLFNQEVSDGYSAFEYTFQNSGPQTIGLVVFNYDNSSAASRLFVDNIEFAAVPLPASLPLFVAGLMGLGWISRRRKI